MYTECGIHTFPIDCFLIAKRLYYVLRPYSSLSQDEFTKAHQFDQDGFSQVELNPDTGLLQYVIYYNDRKNPGRVRWTIFHEIGHIYLGHHDNRDESKRIIEEAEADFFAKYAIAPPPLIDLAGCHDMFDVQDKFDTSLEASSNLYNYYTKWVLYGPRRYEPFEIELLNLFGVA